MVDGSDVFVGGRSRALLALAAAVLFLGVFFLVLFLERPGLGTGHLFYLAILLLAFAGGPATGALGGFVAAGLYSTAIWVNPHTPPASLFTIATSIRLVMFVIVGAAFGWFASRNRSALSQLQGLAERDHLTGLLNSRGFDLALARRAASPGGFTLVFGDMDSLKQINDTFGHAGGDRAIKSAANLLAGSLRTGDDVVARVGGDEFAALVSTTSAPGVQELIERLERALAQQRSPLTFGWAIYPIETNDPFALVRIADKRLYQRKSQNKTDDQPRPLHVAAAD